MDTSIFLSLRNDVVTQRMRENLASETHGSLRVNNQHLKSYNAFKAILWLTSWLTFSPSSIFADKKLQIAPASVHFCIEFQILRS